MAGAGGDRLFLPRRRAGSRRTLLLRDAAHLRLAWRWSRLPGRGPAGRMPFWLTGWSWLAPAPSSVFCGQVDPAALVGVTVVPPPGPATAEPVRKPSPRADEMRVALVAVAATRRCGRAGGDAAPGAARVRRAHRHGPPCAAGRRRRGPGDAGARGSWSSAALEYARPRGWASSPSSWTRDVLPLRGRTRPRDRPRPPPLRRGRGHPRRRPFAARRRDLRPPAARRGAAPLARRRRRAPTSVSPRRSTTRPDDGRSSATGRSRSRSWTSPSGAGRRVRAGRAPSHGRAERADRPRRRHSPRRRGHPSDDRRRPGHGGLPGDASAAGSAKSRALVGPVLSGEVHVRRGDVDDHGLARGGDAGEPQRPARGGPRGAPARPRPRGAAACVRLMRETSPEVLDAMTFGRGRFGQHVSSSSGRWYRWPGRRTAPPALTTPTGSSPR